MGKKKNKHKHLTVKKINHEDLSGILTRARANTLTEDDVKTIQGMAETIELIISMLNQKDVQLKRLLRQLLGIKSESTEGLFKKGGDPDNNQVNDPPDTNSGKTDEEPPCRPKRKGHGKNGADSYSGASRIFISHSTLKPGDPCPNCPKGKVYLQKEKGIFVFICGKAPLSATVYELEKFRCNLCGDIFEATLPSSLNIEEPHPVKHYDETAKSMIALLRYGSGFPLNRISSLQSNLGIPLPVSTAWEKSEEAADKIYPVHTALKNLAANGEILYNDDTVMNILKLRQEIEAEDKKARTGIFTTGIVARVDDKTIALFFTGRQHAGENIDNLLKQRDDNKSPPIQMCDAKSGNTPKNTNTIECNCNTHARRYFVNEIDDFPEQCQYVIADVFGAIYKNDKIAKNMSKEERLKFHQQESGPVIEDFASWMDKQFQQKQVEENSGLGKAILYVQKHFTELTRFLHVPGAPIDNNICERVLKMCILHRKNSLFYKTEIGAYIGDIFMSLIHTCTLNGVNPFDYLTKLQIHSSSVFKNKEEWLPWNYQATLARMNDAANAI